MINIDLNCDMGEGIGNEELIMPYITSANIACGYHAGNEITMWETMQLAAKHEVSIGAHPSFMDKEHFGRLEIDTGPEEIYEWVMQQLLIFHEIATPADMAMKHVKPHGALYNLSAKDKIIAASIAQAVKDYDHELILFGLSGSHSILEAKKMGLKTASEVFADRHYLEDGNLVPRSEPNALIQDTATAVDQALQMVTRGTVVSITGKVIPIDAETICIHGDGEHAVEFAMNIYNALKKEGVGVQSLK
ncbi:MAG TPA: 5-oxoprolinase subunit PxpA [Chitinophagaceae bacterium]|nr:5-oxoprolinase subunit PxpA [Chitinophagaceae bacterium]